MATAVETPKQHSPQAAPPNDNWRPKHNQWLIAITVTLATFMEVLDTSIANVALPHIAGNLSAGQDESTWVLTSYLVSNAVILPMSGWLGTIFGRKRFYMVCVALFGISSFLCGLAPSLAWLVFFRVLQGLGGGGLAPSEQAILADTFPPRQRGMAFALYGFAVVLAPAIGPTLGGYITDNYNWRWIFFINIPVALVSLFLTHRLVEDPPWLKRIKNKKWNVDFIGLGLIALGLGSLQVVLDKGERDDWFGSNFIVTFAILAAIGILGTIVWEYFQPDPIVDIKLFANRTFAISCVMMFMLGLALFGSTVLIPQLLQSLLGYTAAEAGMVLSPGGLVVLFCMPVVGIMVSKLDARYLIAFGFGVSALALYHMTSLDLNISFGEAVKYRMFQALGLAFLFVPINTMSYVGVPREKNNAVSGMTNLFRNIGGSVGISLVETLLSRRSQFHENRLSSNFSNYSEPFRSTAKGLAQTLVTRGTNPVDATQQAYGQLYRGLSAQASALAYIDTIWVFAGVCLVMVPIAFLMKKNVPGAGPKGSH
jgi:DHA2 family multidrug resistance protein